MTALHNQKCTEKRQTLPMFTRRQSEIFRNEINLTYGDDIITRNVQEREELHLNTENQICMEKRKTVLM